ncbi:uroporphyrinogen-III synthase [Neoroseomonas oryzicola]|uniref:Uroporphyrinogen-III synthase n=1 Tax=Neoroseomonas oryzicola TaxID=535904 RepID=A0A9X9WQG7_9PROT|nr:uroporphyrinogen-III synthase [Neoroseomonas oryzicola]MBR0662577.1 uroporphyrinogen-III synthase [Neoroseomonas oryzicola]NKE19231.1 uroporphyrinogen-III synthase [Neoroseomonas oryzicola]
MPRPGVLVTRPEPGAAETAAAVAALGWTPVLAPALLLRPCAPARLPAAQALLLPSRAAARALDPVAMPVLAVGEGTAAEARARGFTDVIAAEGEAATLAILAAARLDPARGPLLLAVGRGYSVDLAAALRARGFRVLRRVTYEAVPAPALPAEAESALRTGQVDAALFTSPRGVRITLGLLRRAGLADAARAIRALAISPRIAEALKSLPWAEIAITSRPDPALLPGLLGPPAA